MEDIKYKVVPDNKYSEELLSFIQKLHGAKTIVALTFKDGTTEFYNAD